MIHSGGTMPSSQPTCQEASQEAPQEKSQEKAPPKASVQRRHFKRIEVKSEAGGSIRYTSDPVCDYCKAKKIGCQHRALYDEDGNLVTPAAEPPALGASKPTSRQSKRTAVKAATTKTTRTEGKENAGSAEPTSSTQRPRRVNAGKRKLDELSTDIAATKDDKRQKTERKKPGRKPRQKTPFPTVPVVIVQDSEGEPHVLSSPPTEPSNAVTEPPAPPVMVQRRVDGAVQGSLDIAYNEVMASYLEGHMRNTQAKWEILRGTIEAAERQWEEVQRSMQATKTFMEQWIEHWKRGTAS